jgi:hypothetical protein
VGDRGIQGSGGDDRGRGDTKHGVAGTTEQLAPVSGWTHADECADVCLNAIPTECQAHLKEYAVSAVRVASSPARLCTLNTPRSASWSVRIRRVVALGLVLVPGSGEGEDEPRVARIR